MPDPSSWAAIYMSQKLSDSNDVSQDALPVRSTRGKL